MQVLPNTSIAVGIEWTLHESLVQAKKAVAGKKKVLVARKIISGECVQGICAAPQKVKKMQAGALLAAAVANDVLIYHTMGGGKAWVCAVREGIPLHGFDVVLDEENAKSTLAEVMSYVPTADIYGDIPGAKGGLQDLLAHVSSQDRKKAELKIPESPVLVLMLVGIILLLAIVLVFGYPLFKKVIDGHRASALQRQRAEELRLAQMAFDAEVARQRQTFWHARSPVRQFGLWYGILRELPVSVEGWVPTRFNCDLNACQVMWRRDFRALPSAAVKLPGKGGDLPFNPNLMEVTTSFAVDKLETVEHASGSHDIGQYLLDLSINTAPFLLTLNTNRSPVNVMPPPGVQGLAPVAIGQEGTWRLSGANVLLLPQYLGKLDLPGVALNSLSIKTLNLGRPQSMIELEGRYRVGN